MKKNVLAQSIATMIGGLCLAGAANAAVLDLGTTADATTLTVSPSGVGHSLLVPYFNAQNGNMSVFHVVNTDTVNGKAVKVRFRSAANSDDILDFQLYMSPGDVWTASVTQGPTAIAQILTTDTTCSVPALTPGVAQSFVTNRLDRTRLTEGEVANQTREGYVEVFTMADIPVDADPDSLYTAIKHVGGNAPPCATAGSAARTLLNATAVSNFTVPADAVTAGFANPTTGLMGDWYIINVPQTTTFSGGATSIAATVGLGGPAGIGHFVHFPQNDSVIAVPGATADFFTADPLFRVDTVNLANVAVAGRTLDVRNYDLPDMSTPYTTDSVTNDASGPLLQAGLLTGALAVTSVTNQYANDASITAKTDWLFSMPTRRYSVAANYGASGYASDDYRLFSNVVAPVGAPGAGLTYFGNNATADNTSLNGGLICVLSDGQRFYDREERTPGAMTPGPIFSPGEPDEPTVTRFCGETSVLAIGTTVDDASVLGASVARQSVASSDVTGPYENGWAVVTTTNGGTGLPIIGSSFIKLANPDVGTGVSGTYGITWPHRTTR
jgi:hypothetical protein